MFADTSLLIVATLTFLLAGFVKGGIGLGLPTVAMGLLSLAMPPAQAASLLVVPSLVTNLWQFAGGPAPGAVMRRLWPMMAGICLGTWAGAGLLSADPDGFGLALLGLALIAYAAFGLSPVKFGLTAVPERRWGPVVGAATGVVTAATGVFVLPAVPFLQALALPREVFVQALGLSFTVSTLALGANLAGGGVLSLEMAGISALAILPAMAGMALGQAVRQRVSESAFRRAFFLGLLALGVHLALRGLA